MATLQRLYRLCKMVSVAQKLNFVKTCEKRLYNHITMVLRKKLLKKRANNKKITRFWKFEKMATLQSL